LSAAVWRMGFMLYRIGSDTKASGPLGKLSDYRELAGSLCVLFQRAPSSISRKGSGKARRGATVFRDLVSQMHVGLEGNFVVHPIVTVDSDTAKGSWLLYIQFARPVTCRRISPT
jgi:hypothetical protein